MALNNWMQRYQDRTLGSLTLPGAHDAGTIDGYVDFTKAGTQKNSVTQSLNISDMLMCGTRFFDLRLKEHGGKVVAHHTTGGQGAYGKYTLGEHITLARNFCNANPSEVVIFRITHTKTATNAHEIVQQAGYGVLSKCGGNLCTKTLQQIRTNGRGGGLVVLFDADVKFKKNWRRQKKEVHSSNFGEGGLDVINQSQGIHSFKKWKGEENSTGISTCGCYSMENKLQNVMRNALKGQYEHVESHGIGTHLWQVYWQKTYWNPIHRHGIQRGTERDEAYIRRDGSGKGTIHGGTHAATAHMIKLMKGHDLRRGEDFKLDDDGTMFSTSGIRQRVMPNIISYDFVNSEMNEQIIRLNDYGGQRH